MSKPDCGSGSISGSTEVRPSPMQSLNTIFIFSGWDVSPMSDCGEKVLLFPILSAFLRAASPPVVGPSWLEVLLLGLLLPAEGPLWRVAYCLWPKLSPVTCSLFPVLLVSQRNRRTHLAGVPRRPISRK